MDSAIVETVNCIELKQRVDQLISDRAPVEAVWDRIARFFVPMGSGSQPAVDIAGEGGAQQSGSPEVWDSTAIDSAQKLAASIHGAVTSPAIRWFKLAWRDQELKDDQDSASWLDLVADRVFQTLQDSDFDTEIASADQDLVGFGNTIVVEEPADSWEWRGVDFEAVPLREAYFEPDSRGEVMTFYRRLSWTAGQILDRCRRRGCPPPERIAQAHEGGKDITRRYTVIFCIFEREEAKKKIAATHRSNSLRYKQRREAEARHADAMRRHRAALIDAPEGAEEPAEPEMEPVQDEEPTYPLAEHLRPYGCVYFLHEGGERIGGEGGYYEMPVCIARWQKTTGSIWGHGPCHILLPTVQYLNGWMETAHQGFAKAVDGTWGVTERGLLSDPDLTPGGFTVFRDKDSVWPLQPNSDHNVAQFTLEDLRGMVRRGLHNDELTLRDSPAMTATEVQARYELMNRVLGSTLARIEKGLLSPVVKITIGHLLRARQLPEMPAKVLEKYRAGKVEFNIEYQGPLARSQRTDEVAAIERVLAFAAGLLKMGVPMPVVMATIDVVKAIRDIATLLGTPANLLKAPEEVQKAIEQIQELDRRMAAAQTAKVEGEAAANHAAARASMVSADMAAQGGAAAGDGLPVPASPPPIVSPAYPPTVAA